MKKVTKTQAKAVARTLFGGACSYLGNLSDEPQVKVYVFARGIFQISIYDNRDTADIFVGDNRVGRIHLDDPLDITFHKMAEVVK